MLNKVKQLFDGKKSIFAIILAVIALMFALLFTPIFHVKNIQVIGIENIDSNRVIDASGLSVGKSIFKTNFGMIKKSVLKVAYVENVKVRLKLPNTVVIEITEGKTAAYINFAGNYIAINENGRILDVTERSDGITKPVVYGVSVEGFEIGQDIVADDNNRKEVLFSVLEQTKACNLTGDIMYIDVNDTDNITFTLRNKTAVKVGNTEGIRYKMAYLRSVIDTFTDEEGGMIDLRDTNNVYYDAG